MNIETLIWQIGIQYAAVSILAPVALAIVYKKNTRVCEGYMLLAIAMASCVALMIAAVKATPRPTPQMDDKKELSANK